MRYLRHLKAGILLLLLLLALFRLDAIEARNVIVLIGDGMGPKPLALYRRQCGDGSFAQFTGAGRLKTLNCESKITDSAAAGTALACGEKTRNGIIGMPPAGMPLTSIAKMLKARGWKVGVITSVAINDATPAVFYANRESRKMALAILGDLAASRFDFFSGGSVATPSDYTDKKLAALLKRGGYKLGKTGDQVSATAKEKPFLIGNLYAAWTPGPRQTPSLAEVTAEAIKLLDNPKGFFLMVEGGAIDRFGHCNDTAGMLREIGEFDAAIGVALDFRRRHPDTLVIVTADHDTGGMKLADGAVSPDLWKKQPQPFNELQSELEKQLKAKRSEAEIRGWLGEMLGLTELSPDEIEAMHQAYQRAVGNDDGAEKSKYGRYSPLLVQAMRLRDRRMGVSWSSFGHSDEPVPLLAAGPAEDTFKRELENSELPGLIAQAMPSAGIDFPAEHRAPPLPPVAGKSAVDCLLPLAADADCLTFQYGLLKTPAEALKIRLLDDAGRELASETRHDRCGRVTFKALQPDTPYQLKVELDGKTADFPMRTLPAPKEKKLFTFAFVTDTHLSLDPDLPYGRLHSLSVPVLKRIFEDLEQRQVPLLIHGGDVTDASRPEELQVLAPLLPLYRGKIIAVPGNHDRLKGDFATAWRKLFGAPAGLYDFKGVQILALDTANGRLAAPGNAEAIAKLDPERPAIIVSHYQLIPDPQIKDKDAAIHDRDEQQTALRKLGDSRSVIYVGHKNIPCRAELGKVPQINGPQTTQFVDGYLLVDVYPSGVVQRFVPIGDAYISERSRLLGGGALNRTPGAFAIWNAFIPWPSK